VGEIEVIETGDRVRVDQTELETVLPSIGGRVLVLRGGAGVVNREAKLTGIDADAYKATAEMTDGPERGKTFAFDYEDVCKLSSSGPR
jgi:DNA/RNA-binding protein KIN17